MSPSEQPLLPDVAVRSEKREHKPRLHLRLKAKQLDHLPPGRYADGDGLILQVSKTGARSWLLRTRVRGRRMDIGLGGLQHVSLAQAREVARQLRGIARSGGDPKAARDKNRSPVLPFKKAAATVHSEHEKAWKNRKHARQWITTLEQYVFPTLGDTPVDVIRSEHIVRVLHTIWLTKPETARRVLQRIGMVLLWAKGTGLRTDSPTDEVRAARHALPRQIDQTRHHKALPYADVPALIEKLRSFSTSEPIKLGLEFLILTASRTNEVLYAKWPEVNLEEQVWTIPATRMKAKREHQVPLSDRCIEILKAARAPNEDPHGYLFPGTISGRSLSDMAFLMVLRRMGLDITAHGFRSTFRVWCAEQTSFASQVAEAALAHKVRDATEAAYMRSTLLERRRPLMEAWGTYAAGTYALSKAESQDAVTNRATEVADV
jgi:integrase